MQTRPLRHPTIEIVSWWCTSSQAIARGYITKREAPRDLVPAARDVLEGWTLVGPRAAEGLP